MRKIISLFKRSYETDGLVRDEYHPNTEWVIAGEGIATRKLDGTCCLVRDGKLFKRYDAKHGKKPPADFEPAQEPDLVTGHWPGWIPVGLGPEDRWHREAFESPFGWSDGTYELCGPKVQANPERFSKHVLLSHVRDTGLMFDPPRDFAGLKDYLTDADVEGIVWHHQDGRMVKIKTKDFGLKRNNNV